MKGLGVNILPTNIGDEEPVNDDQSDIDDADIGQTDNGFDWWQDALDLDITSIQMKDVHDWVKVQKLKANIDHSEETTIDVNTLNEEQRKVFIVVKDSVDKSVKHINDQKLVDMSGGAGTGKSYVIKAIMQYAQDISGHRNLVKVAAPTGNAASLFSGRETLHSMLKIPAEKWFSEPLEDLVGEPLADLQKKFKDTQVLIIDEKGMVGLGRLAQINKRLKQAKPEQQELPFGGITILLSGDFRQLLLFWTWHSTLNQVAQHSNVKEEFSIECLTFRSV